MTDEAAAAKHVDDTIADLIVAIEVCDDLRVGFVEVARLSIGPDAYQEIAEAIGFLERRIQLMGASLSALETMKAHGYPVVPKKIVSGEIQEELYNKYKSIELALEEVRAGKLKLAPPVAE